MRLILFFDLPVETSQERREYSCFHRYLVKNGFIMMQESVYCKLSLNATSQKSVIENIRKNKPSKGLVQILSVTEKQYSRIEYLVGQYNGDIITSDERFLEL